MTIVVAILSLILGALVARHYSTRRILAIVIPSLFDIVDLSRVAKDKIKVLYQDKPIGSLWVIRVVIQNQGNYDLEKKLVRSEPKVSLGDFAIAIDVEPVNIDKEASIQTTIEEGKFITFHINYLQRGKQAAFQVLAHTTKGFDLKPNDIILDRGIIENTDVRLVNLLTGGFRGVTESLYCFIRERLKLFAWAYIIIGCAFVIYGLINAIYPDIVTLIGMPHPTTIETVPRVVFPIIIGFLFIFPMYHILRRHRYIGIFNQKKENSLE